MHGIEATPTAIVRQAEESREQLYQRAAASLSQCSWVLGECASALHRLGDTDEVIGQRLGLPRDQVTQRRLVWEKFGRCNTTLALSWSHHREALGWDDAAEALRWAADMDATVAEMKAWQRSQAGEDLRTRPESDDEPFGAADPQPTTPAKKRATDRRSDNGQLVSNMPRGGSASGGRSANRPRQGPALATPAVAADRPAAAVDRPQVPDVQGDRPATAAAVSKGPAANVPATSAEAVSERALSASEIIGRLRAMLRVASLDADGVVAVGKALLEIGGAMVPKLRIAEMPAARKGNGFQPPTLEEVTAYCEELRSDGKSCNVDPERWIDFYGSKNWMVGKVKMKDWKSALRNAAREGWADKGRAALNAPRGSVAAANARSDDRKEQMRRWAEGDDDGGAA